MERNPTATLDREPDREGCLVGLTEAEPEYVYDSPFRANNRKPPRLIESKRND